jgi:1-acyl-sn-glycerol-3-phosphate acyltransferase
MQDQPRRLKPQASSFGPSPEGATPLLMRERRVLRKLRAGRRGLLILLWTIIACVIQAVLLPLPGRPKVVFARWYWATNCRLLGMRIRRIGQPARADKRAVVFISNHSSWLDIAVLGAELEACFVSKDDVANWPVVNVIARLGRTVFVSRKASATGRERNQMAARLAAGDNLVLFPEGTSSDGSRVLPFRTPFFALAEGENAPLIQPVSLVYDRLAGLPAGRTARPLFAWYGDMDLATHFWRLAQWQGMRASVLLHPPLDPRDFPSRKALAQAAWNAVAGGASLLRQNRAVTAEAVQPVAAAPLAEANA